MKTTEALFDPLNYLRAYYSKLEVENQFLLKFFHRVYSCLNSPKKTLVEIGGGPTIYQLISAADKVDQIIFSEYLQANQKEIIKWKKQDANCFNWDQYFNYVLKLEGKPANQNNRLKKKQILRKRIKQIISCDIFKNNPIDPLTPPNIDVVSVNFTPESVTDNREAFNLSIKNICSLLGEKSLLIMTLLRNAHYYKVGRQKFKTYPINEAGIKQRLQQNDVKLLTMETYDSPYHKGYDGVIALTGIKKTSS